MGPSARASQAMLLRRLSSVAAEAAAAVARAAPLSAAAEKTDEAARGPGSAAVRAHSCLGPAPVVCVSSCLLGHSVAFHGGSAAGSREHRHEEQRTRRVNLHLRGRAARRASVMRCLAALQRAALLRPSPLCPEVDVLGLPVPRAPLRLVRSSESGGGDGDHQHQVTVASTGAELHGVAGALSRLAGSLERLGSLGAGNGDCAPDVGGQAVCGFIGKGRSPSCGIADARVYGGAAGSFAHTDGFFVRHLADLALAEGRPPRCLSALNADEARASFIGGGAAPAVAMTEIVDAALAPHLADITAADALGRAGDAGCSMVRFTVMCWLVADGM